MAEDVSCDKIETDVDVYYEGQYASQEEIDEMFAMLTEIIQEQEASGQFAEAGLVGSVGATSTENTDGSFGGFGADGGRSAGLPVGVVVGTLAVVGLVGGIWYRSRKRRSVIVRGQDKNDNHHTDDSSNE